MVGTAGFEPVTSCSQSKRSTRLSYVPNSVNLYLAENKLIASIFFVWIAVARLKLNPLKTAGFVQ